LRTALRLLAPDAGPSVRRGVARAIAFGSLSAIAAVAVIGLSGGLIVQAAQRPPVLELTMVIVLVRTFSIVRATARYGERLASHDAALGLLEGVRVRVFARFAKAVPGSATDRAGDALDQAVGDVDRAADLLIRVLVPAASAIVAVVVAVGVAGWLDARVAITIAGGCAALGLVVGWRARAAGRALADAETSRAALGRDLVTALDAGPELLLAGRTADHLAAIDRRAVRLERAAAVHGTRSAALGGVVATGGAAMAIVVAALASGQIGDGSPRGAVAAGLVLGALGCAERLEGLVEAGLALPAALAAVARLAPALLDVDHDASPAIPGRRAVTGARPRVTSDPALVASDVVVRRGSRTIVDHAALTAGPGERVALTGESGSGKSTLVLALSGLLPAAAGVIRLGDVDVTTLTERERQQSVLLVPSAPHLFGGTVAANLRAAAVDASDRDLGRALEAVGLGAWLAGLPDGLESRLGEGGVTASGGERQRIGLARAYLSRAQLVLLDEPASHLPESDAIQALSAVLRAVPGRSAVLVSHRAAERRLATREVRLTGGRTAAASLAAA
jgi:thiol reductant ABC exporter CydC subunit